MAVRHTKPGHLFLLGPCEGKRDVKKNSVIANQNAKQEIIETKSNWKIAAKMAEATLHALEKNPCTTKKTSAKKRSIELGKERGKRTSQRALFGGCVLLLVGFWVRRGAP